MKYLNSRGICSGSSLRFSVYGVKLSNANITPESIFDGKFSMHVTPARIPQREASVNKKIEKFVCLFVGCLASQQHASVSQGRICSDNFTCCHTEIEVADQTVYLTQSQYTDTGPTSHSADPITPGAWQGSHWSANF